MEKAKTMLKNKNKRQAPGFKLPSVETSAYKADCKAFGIVIYGDNSIYKEDKEENKNIHIDLQKSEIAYFLFNKIRTELGVDATNIIVGHEHGDENKKCHFQCCVKLVKRISKMVGPFSADMHGIKILGMFQKAKTPDALWNYCKKDGDFYVHEPEEIFSNVWDRIVSKKDMSTSELTNVLAQGDAKSLLMWGDKIQNNYDNLLKAKELPPFEWCFPPHLLTMMEDQLTFPSTVLKIKAIDEWFKTQCVVENLSRRQALFLISLERGLGKSEFAKRLVPDEGYYIYCRNSLDAAEFKRKERTAKLIILDDVSYIGNEKEMWKALISGECVNINTKYYNYKWKGGIPCIVLTNEMSTVSYWTKCEAFSTQCSFVNIDFYLGPTGTRPSYLGYVKTTFDDDFSMKLGAYEAMKEYNKKNQNK
jgi:hypothetical protein